MNSTSSSSAAAWPACSAALHLAPTHRVAVITKRAMSDGASELGAGRHRGRAGRGRQRRVARRRHAGRGRRPLRPGRHALRGRARARSHRWLRELGVPFSREDGRAAPHARRRPQPAPHRARGRRHRRRRAAHADRAGARARPTSRCSSSTRGRPDHAAASWACADTGCLGLYALDEATDEVVDLPRAAHRARHRRRRQGLPLHDQSRHRHRRRHRDGLARGLPRSRTWSSSSSTRPACTTRTPSPS